MALLLWQRAQVTVALAVRLRLLLVTPLRRVRAEGHFNCAQVLAPPAATSISVQVLPLVVGEAAMCH